MRIRCAFCGRCCLRALVCPAKGTVEMEPGLKLWLASTHKVYSQNVFELYHIIKYQVSYAQQEKI